MEKHSLKRSLTPQILKDLEQKFVLLSGPRQSGKTTLAKNLETDFEYLNYDILAHRKQIIRGEWNRAPGLLILDEIHKMKKWKLWLKGLYDEENHPRTIVTGSARIDTHKKVGDSLAGRYFQFHLLPLDLKELADGGWKKTPAETLERLLKLSGFPEPFLSDSESHYKRWRKTHLDIIVKQDIPATESIKRISDLETLIEFMVEKIGSTLSYNSLREDLSTDDKTVKRWLLALENSYVFFKIAPYSKKLKNVLTKAPKYYFFDVPRVSSPGARLENLVAFSLYKECLFRADMSGEDYSLHFLHAKAGQEIDFLICLDKKPIAMIEVKTQDKKPSPNFSFFAQDLKKQNPELKMVQLVKGLDRPFTSRDGVHILNLEEYLLKMPF